MSLMPAKSLTEKSGEVKDYFEKLGYQITWDFKTTTRETWWEIIKGEKLVAQIDMGVPLCDIIEDFCQFYLGKSGTSKSNYKVNGYGPVFDEMLEKVYNEQHH